MELVYKGKTKDVYRLDDGNIRLYFKDDVTGANGVFDPGANAVGLTVKDAGYYGLLLSRHFFELFEENGLPTHYISCEPEKREMVVKPVEFFGEGIEVICRLTATGSFIRRYGGYAWDGMPMDYYTEVSLKDDDRGDPFISKELLELFGILQQGEYKQLIDMTVKGTRIIKDELEKHGIDLLDLKFEFGKDAGGKIIMIDEISGGNLRTRKNEKAIEPIELTKIVLGL